MEKEANTSEETPKWLLDTQNRSWEPEILISGLTLTSLFIFPTKLHNLFATLVQEYGLTYAVADVLFTYLSMVLTAFKITFIGHLIFRFTWAAMVGASYVFPQGVNHDKLPKKFKKYRFKPPVHFVIWLEKLSSLMFSVPLSFAIIMLLFTSIMAIFTLIAIQFNLGYEAMILSVLFFIIVIFSFTYGLRNSKLGEYYNTSLVNMVSFLHQTNLGKVRSYGIIVLIVLISLPFMHSDKKRFHYFENQADQRKSNIEWLSLEEWYEDNHLNENRFAKCFIPSVEISGKSMPVSLAYFKEDKFTLEKIREGKVPIADSLHWKPVSGESIADVYRVFLDEKEIDSLEFSGYRYDETDQRLYRTYLNVADLQPGEHTLRIEKIYYISVFGQLKRFKLREKWAVVRFRKV